MAYEEDLDVDDMDDEMRRAIEESKKSAPKKKKTKKNNDPDQQLVESITQQFGGYFNQTQVKDYLMNNQNDVDKAI